MNRSIQLLLVDDMEDEALLLVAELERQGFNIAWRRVETAVDLEAALQEQDWDMVFCDYVMPNFSGPRAVQLIKQRHPDLPVIMVSGRVEEELSVEVMRNGAADSVQKHHRARLGPAVARELEEAAMRRERRSAREALSRL
ncbi:MAG: response regulator [Deltaproteobacteria bacterium]|nr:response regulator [Deltaproteobacteria bacterium]